MPRNAHRLNSRRSNRLNNPPAYFCESLESRTLLSTINWVNRGVLSGANSDRINDVFGPVYAGQVRPLIDAVLQSWSRVISNFNYPGGGNTYNMTIQFAAGGVSGGANGFVTSNASDGKPLTGSMIVGRGSDTSSPADGIGDGGGWFVDTTPLDNSEFQSSTTNGFAGYTTAATSPALNLGDMYEVVMHEMGHALGLLPSTQVQAHSTNTNVSTTGTPTPGTVDTLDSPASTPVSTYWRFDGAHVKTLETSYDSGGQATGPFNANGSQHHAPAGASVTVNGITYLGSDDLMTPYYSNSQRRLISDTDAWMLADSYGYSIQLPSTFGTFYDTLDSDGTLRINTPGSGNDIIVIDQSGSNVIVNLNLGTPVAGADITNSIASLFPAASVQKIVINAGGGADTIRLENSGGKPITVNGGGGDDTINLEQTYRNLDQFGGGAVVVNGDGGTDSVFIYDNNNTRADTYRINSSGINRDSWSGLTYGTGIEHVSLTTGSGNNPVSIISTNANQDVTLNSAGGSDTVAIGGTGTTQSLFGNILVQNTPSFTTITVDDTNDFGSRDIVIDNSGNLGVLTGITGPIGGTISWVNNDLSSLSITLSQFGSGTVSVQAMNKPLTLHNQVVGNQGANYAVSLGNSSNGMQSILSSVTLIAAYGQNQSLTFNDSANTVGKSASLVRSSTNGDYSITGLTPGTILFRDFGSLTVQQGSGNDTFSAGGASQGGYDNDLPMTVNGNGGNDTYNLTTFNNWGDLIYGTFTWPVMFDGGIGYNTLSIDDTTRGGTSYQFYADRFYSREPTAFSVGADFTYDGMKAIGLSCSNSANAVAIYGISSDIDVGNQVSISLAGGNDGVTVFPHDAQGNLTINGNVGIGGGTGSDTLLVNDAAATLPITYSFINPYGAGTQNISGMGTGGFGIGNDFEAITMNGGAGNDTYNISSYKSGMGLAINGGNGNDTVNYGLSVVTSEVTLMSSFSFNGQGDFDTFNFNNPNTTGAATYTRTAGNLSVSPAAGGGYSLFESNNELMQIFAGSGADGFYVNSSAAGNQTIFNAGGAADSAVLGSSTNNLDSIHGPVVYNAGAGGGNMYVFDSADTTGDTAHLTDSTLGAFPGDNLFGAGGSLAFSGVTTVGSFPGLTLNLGSGADTLFAQPLANAKVTISAGNPAAAPGDTLNLALATAQSYAINGTPASGNVTSTNLQTLTWTGFESGPNVDAVAPGVVVANINVDGAAAPGAAALRANTAALSPPLGGGPSLDIQFSEGVALLLGTGAIQLTNVTTGVPVPQSSLAMTYDPATQIAHFTFPGFSNGILPDGNYQGKVLAGSTDDLYGNALAADASFDFFILAGDANHDRIVDINDLYALASNWQGDGKVFSQGDFNYDGTVNANDLGVLSSKWQQSLPALPPAAAPATIKTPVRRAPVRVATLVV